MNMTVRDWFDARSFRYPDFARWPAEAAAGRAHDHAGPPGPQCRRHHRPDPAGGGPAGRDRTGLIDQVLVVDADSPDGTAAIARAHGAEVYSENELITAYGPVQGKGDAMWRSLSVARGDVVMFADADTRDFGEHFIYGTLGPVLTVPGVRFAKAAYRRPFTQRGESVVDGGGRVTELMAKPLLNLYRPELAGFVQPLAGEFAAHSGAAVRPAVPHRLRGGAGAAHRRAGRGRPARHGPGRPRLAAEPAPAAVGPDPDELHRAAGHGQAAARRRPGTRPTRATATCWTWSRETYLHAVATADGLRLDEHLNELVERPRAGQRAAGRPATASPDGRLTLAAGPECQVETTRRARLR